MKGKVLSLFVATTMAIGLLAGCGQGSGSTDTTSAPADTTGAQSEAAGDDTQAETEAGSAEAGETEAAASTGELKTVNVAFMPNYASLWAVATADQKGYFAEEGLEVNMVMFQDGPTEIASMESGSIDVAYIGPGAHTLAIQGNVDVFCFQQLGNADSVVGLVSHGVESLEDLEGKTVGYASGTSSETILRRALASVGLTMDDIQAYDMEISNMISAMVSGSLDACAPWSPSTNTILSEMGDDAKVLCTNVSFSDEAADCASWVCIPSYAEENKDTLVSFTRALYKAMDYGSQEANYDEVAGYVAEACGTDKASALEQTSDGAWLDSATLLQYVDDGTIEGYYAIQEANFVADGKLTEEEGQTPVSDFVLFDIMKEAGQ
ncbi:NitT/TauT family transport system substrate-binding protein [Catenibacillus scindens]|uniref:NitT/TauT family transport system substrate-binding protein n=1 Tax=Catenibacillus scindens TaxID=673271 RepID=A0A7W8M605_9FIRM|nr:ABC transporter substrate-binding protein [Catenibacillus scindens]MBB5265102.1 NitT/TauT family transport system substrate-binding protein [Catenibacillus scindens]